MEGLKLGHNIDLPDIISSVLTKADDIWRRELVPVCEYGKPSGSSLLLSRGRLPVLRPDVRTE